MTTTIINQKLTDTGNDYRYKRFTTSLLFRDLRFGRNAAKPGDPFPLFELFTTSNERLTNRDVFGNRPVLLIFGSMTCPMTASAAPSVQQLYDTFGDRVDFIMIYVREAHPGEHFAQSESMQEKLEYAKALKEFYNIHWTVAADNIDGDLHRALDSKPNTAYLMDSEGCILFRSLWAADYQALHQALNAATSGRLPGKNQSQALIGPVIRAMGHVQEVMERAGPQAVKDLWRAGFPMAVAGRLAKFFSPLSPDRRGIASVLTLVLGMILAVSILGAWVLT